MYNVHVPVELDLCTGMVPVGTLIVYRHKSGLLQATLSLKLIVKMYRQSVSIPCSVCMYHQSFTCTHTIQTYSHAVYMYYQSFNRTWYNHIHNHNYTPLSKWAVQMYQHNLLTQKIIMCLYKVYMYSVHTQTPEKVSPLWFIHGAEIKSVPLYNVTSCV